mmetsp:Transcript_13849/g.28030  ORF Transcript_13849/g.28030 Transcript_13849/m.28030 type:complete len:720 (-) Transcript_13849:154-2313(-)
MRRQGGFLDMKDEKSAGDDSRSPRSVGRGGDSKEQMGEKNALVDQMMHEQRHKWAKPRDLTVFCATWNVNAKVTSESLAPWLKPDEKLPDVFAIGMQEVVELNAVNIGMSDANSAKQSSMWEIKIEKEVLQGRYERIMGKHFVGLMMVVYVKKDIYSAVSGMAYEKIGVGKMGLGNKGAICIRMNFWETSVCFVNTHLTAGKSKVMNRNNDFETIISKVAIKLPTGLKAMIKDHDYCFWVGDLNYRLNATDLNDVYKRIRTKPPDMSYLLNSDQLITERSAGRAFVGFHEQDLTFLPTYKYLPGTPDYDDREEGKRRMPAWCDRVQWYQHPKYEGLKVTPQFYKRAELRCSDHKPVMAKFTTVAMMSPTKQQYDEFREGVIRKLDVYENEHIPQVSLSKSTIEFGPVKFDERSSDTLTITNTGKAMAEFHFVPLPGTSEPPIKPWVTVDPESCLLVPGASKDLLVTAHITKEHAQAFTKGEEKIDHILILQLRPGRGARTKKDTEGMMNSKFISVNGRYMASCFGCSLEHLVKQSKAVRSPQNSLLNEKQAYKIPKELWRIVDHLYRRGGLYEVDLFNTEGDPEQVAEIIECLDTDTEFEQCTIHSMAETLIRFLRNLKEPVFSFPILNQVAETWGHGSMHVFCKVALRQLTELHFRVFVYIVAFLREILKHREHNGLSVEALVHRFSCLFEKDPLGLDSGESRARKLLQCYLSAENFT